MFTLRAKPISKCHLPVMGQHQVHDLHDTFNPNMLVIAAIAFGTHLVSFRTQKLSRNT